MRTRGTWRALGAPIVAACVAACGVPAVAIAVTGTPSKSTSTTTRVAKRVAMIVPRFAFDPIAESVQAGHFTTLNGRLLPAAAGETVQLAGHSGGRWATMASARTGRAGGFALRALARAGSTALRVSFAGGRGVRAAAANAGTVVGLEPTVASWYYDAGATACGFHAFYGVANKTLPCGTKVTIEYGGRSLVATVDDRGPYVYGRTYDLNQNVSARLGMYGVATVLASVL